MSKRRLVYIAAPYSPPASWPRWKKRLFGKLAIQNNVQKARAHARDVAAAGGFPITPHLVDQGIESIGPYEFWCAGLLDLMHRCDGVYAPPGWEQSKGALAEIRAADRALLPVFYDLKELQRWCKKEPFLGLLRDCPYKLHSILSRAPQTLNLRNLRTNQMMEVRAWRVQEGDLDPTLYTMRPIEGGFAVYENESGELVFQTEAD